VVEHLLKSEFHATCASAGRLGANRSHASARTQRARIHIIIRKVVIYHTSSRENRPAAPQVFAFNGISRRIASGKMIFSHAISSRRSLYLSFSLLSHTLAKANKEQAAMVVRNSPPSETADWGELHRSGSLIRKSSIKQSRCWNNELRNQIFKLKLAENCWKWSGRDVLLEEAFFVVETWDFSNSIMLEYYLDIFFFKSEIVLCVNIHC